MSGGFSASGLITGIDSNALIRQLIQIERQPILRIQDRIKTLEGQKGGIQDLKSKLFSLRNLVKDFQLGSVFGSFLTESSNPSAFTASASGPNPASGSYLIDVQQVATATVATSSASVGAPIDPNVPLASSTIAIPVINGSFTINGVSFGVDPNLQTLNEILNAINASAAGVTATFDAATDTVKFANSTPGDTTIINFGASADTGNFLQAINITGAPQLTGGSGSTEAVSTRPLAAINPATLLNAINFAGGAVSAGSFQINSVAINVDPTTDTLSDVLQRINDSDAGVTASFDSSTNTVRVVSNTLGSRTISFTSGTSNFLDITNLTSATQSAGNDAQFTINGGPVITRNSNTVSDAITDITLSLTGVGTSTLSVSEDNESALEKVREFITQFNESITQIRDLIGEEGDLRSDGTIRGIESRLRNEVFSTVSGLSGDFDSLAFIGITSGASFDSAAPFQLELDETKFNQALADDRTNVEQLFTNASSTGVFDQMFDYLDQVTDVTGPLNVRSRANGSIDTQIDRLNDRIESIERRVQLKEQRLRAKFAALERIVNSFQSQGSSLAALGGGFQGVQSPV